MQIFTQISVNYDVIETQRSKKIKQTSNIASTYVDLPRIIPLKRRKNFGIWFYSNFIALNEQVVLQLIPYIKYKKKSNATQIARIRCF